MPKYGDVREDGRLFRGHQRRGDKVYEHWVTPEAWNKRLAARRAWQQRRDADPKHREDRREFSRQYARKWRAGNAAKAMLVRARFRARQKGVPFDLKLEDIQVPERCPVLDLPLRVAAGSPDDSSPELDRVVPALGYVPGNVIVISRRANRIKNDATVRELQLIASFYSGLQSQGPQAGQAAEITKP